uniref:Rhodopsin n=1 Tax=Oryza punctata TaxID=4537 RepID=A0A0E0LMR6_ORYPU
MSYYGQQPPVGVPPQQGYPGKDGYPPPGYPPAGYPPAQGYPPAGYPPQQGYPPPYAQPPPQQQQHSSGPSFMEGCNYRTLISDLSTPPGAVAGASAAAAAAAAHLGCPLLLLSPGRLLLRIEATADGCKRAEENSI